MQWTHRTVTSSTLGSGFAKWIDSYLLPRPGDPQGEPVKVDAEMQRFILEAYRLDPVMAGTCQTRVLGRARTEIAASWW